jgi:hypothetical protein
LSGSSSLTCPAWEPLPVAMLPPVLLSASSDYAIPATTSKYGFLHITCPIILCDIMEYILFVFVCTYAVFLCFGITGLFKMIHPISDDCIFEVYKYRVISDISTKRTTVEVLSLTL